MCEKHFTVSLAFKVFFFATRIKMFVSAIHLKAWNNWIGHKLDVIVMQLTWTYWLLSMFCQEETQKLVWSSYFSAKNQKQSSQIKFWCATSIGKYMEKKLPVNNEVIKIKQRHVSKLGCRGMDCLWW